MTTINTDQIQQILSKYLNGNLSVVEERKLLHWVKKSPENQQQFYELKDLWDASRQEQKARTSEQLLKFYQKQANHRQTKKLVGWRAAITIAAVLVLGLVIGSIMQSRFGANKSQLESFFVPKGSRSEIMLSDGTKVHLNSNSFLEFGNDFSTKNRIVHLEGEAYFEVKADRQNPFIVKTTNFDIVVTGTKFNVSSYEDDQLNSATLTEGKIQLYTTNDKSFVLNPGEKITLIKSGHHYSLEEADIQSEIAWVNNEFIFKEIPFSDLIKRLERWYDVQLIYDGKEFSDMTYSGSFKNQETIWQVLDALQLTTPIDYKKISFRKFKLNYKPM